MGLLSRTFFDNDSYRNITTDHNVTSQCSARCSSRDTNFNISSSMQNMYENYVYMSGYIDVIVSSVGMYITLPG